LPVVVRVHLLNVGVLRAIVYVAADLVPVQVIIRIQRAIVARIADAVLVCVLLVWVGHVYAVVHGVRYAVLITVAHRRATTVRVLAVKKAIAVVIDTVVTDLLRARAKPHIERVVTRRAAAKPVHKDEVVDTAAGIELNLGLYLAIRVIVAGQLAVPLPTAGAAGV
jgi:hypothetical protein